MVAARIQGPVSALHGICALPDRITASSQGTLMQVMDVIECAFASEDGAEERQTSELVSRYSADSELLGLKWSDIDFERLEISVVRDVVNQWIERCKTEASKKLIPSDAET